MPNELQIPYEVYRKIFCYAEIAAKDNNEILLLLKLQEIDEGGLTVEDAILPEQEVGGASCEMKTGKWMKTVKKDDWIKIRGWCHSHCKMGCFHSGTDDDTLEDKWNGESKNSSPYGVSLVVSLPDNMKAWVTYYKPFAMKKVEIPINILNWPQPPPDPMMKTYEAEVKDRVKTWSYKQTWPQTQFQGKPVADSCRMTSVISKYDHDEEESDDPEDLVWDHATGYSIKELKEFNMWDPEVYVDLLEELAAYKMQMPNKVNDTIPERPNMCPHLSLNGKQRWICFFSGKTFDCAKCKHCPAPSKAPPAKEPVVMTLPAPPVDHTKSSSGEVSSASPPIGPDQKHLNNPFYFMIIIYKT